MGYDLHITPRKHWPDKGADITADEWLAYVRRNPELQLRPENGPCFAAWSGPCKLDEPWLDWSDGQIYAKNPDAALIDKMVAGTELGHMMIAHGLTPTAQGDKP